MPPTQKVQNSVPKNSCVTAEARDPGPDLEYSAYYSCYLRWLWKACGCNGLWPLVVESLSNWGHSMVSVCFQSSSGRDSSLSQDCRSKQLPQQDLNPKGYG